MDRRRRMLMLATTAAVLALPGSAAAATFTVTRTDDAAGECAPNNCTLRQAVQSANGNPGADTISIPAGTFTLTLPGSDDDSNATGDLDVTDPVTFAGAGAGQTKIDGTALDDGIIDAFDGANDVTLKGVTLTGPSGDNAVDDEPDGAGKLTLDGSEITGNDASAIEFSTGGLGDLTLLNSAITNNTVSSGAFATIIDDDPFRTGGTLTITGSKLTGNKIENVGSEGLIDFNPSNRGDLTSAIRITDSQFTDNALGGRGGVGALQIDPSATGTGTLDVSIVRSTFSSNQAGAGDGASGNGGAIGFYPCDESGTETSMTITDSRFSNNKAGNGGSGTGGAIDWSPCDHATLTISGSTFDGNHVGSPDASGNGGAIAMRNGTLDVSNSTFTGNRVEGARFSQGGGAISLRDPITATLTNVTIDGNSVQGTGHGGGILAPSNNDDLRARASLAPGTGVEVTVTNSIVAGNTLEPAQQQPALAAAAANSQPDDCFGVIGSGGHNIEGAKTCDFDQAGDKQDTDPKLAALADNGGPTPTQAIGKDSPAFDAADDSKCPATDQRGVKRPQFAHCDIGAFELAPPPPPPAQQQQQQPAAQPPAQSQGGVLGASSHKCVSRRHFRIRLRVPHGQRAVKAVVRVNGKRIAVRRGHRLTSIVNLRGLPKGRFTVSITLTLANGRTIKGKRRYHTCVPAQNDGIPPKV